MTDRPNLRFLSLRYESLGLSHLGLWSATTISAVPWHVVGGIGLASCLMLLAGCELASSPSESVAEKRGPVEIRGELHKVEYVTWPTVVRLQGSLFADDVTVIASKVPGLVERIDCELGDAVATGDELAKIEDSEFRLRVEQGRAQLAQARAVVGLKPEQAVSELRPENAPPVRETLAILEESRQQVNRLRKLIKQGAVVATDLEAALSAERVAEARYNSSLNSVREKIAMIDVQATQLELAQQQLRDSTLYAPYDAKIQRRLVAEGTFVQIGEPIVEIARTSVLRYRAPVPERYARSVRPGQPVRLTVGTSQIDVQVDRISPTIDPISRSLVIEAEVPNAEGRIPAGLFAQAELVLDESAEAIAVPRSCVVRFAGVEKVWRVLDGQVSEAIVQTGREAREQIEILNGLNVGEAILQQGSAGKTGVYQGAGPAVETGSAVETGPAVETGSAATADSR